VGAFAVLAEHPGYRPRGRLLVPTSLDEYEDALRRPRVRRQAGLVGRGSAIDPWPFVEGIPDHPGYGLSPQRVHRIFRESENGCLRELQDLYDDLLESDGHLRSQFESRISAVAGKGRTIQPGGPDDASVAAATDLIRALEERDVDMVEMLEHQLEAPFRGYSASEIIWEEVAGVWAPVAFDNVAHRRFTFVPGTNELRLFALLRGLPLPTSTFGEELLPDKWVLTRARHSNLARAGLFRTATWWCLFKRLSVRDWIVLAEIFGIPHRLGFYGDNTPQEARTALEQALVDIGEGGQAVLHESTRIEINSAQIRQGDSTIHPSIVERCDAEISKLMSGATLTVETGGPGSFALGKVHQDRAFALELADANRVQRIWRCYVAVPFTGINGYAARGAKPPQLNIQVVPSLDPETRAKVLSILVNECGLEIDGWHVAEQMGFRRPLRPEDATKPLKAKSKESTGPSDERMEQLAALLASQPELADRLLAAVAGGTV